MNLKSIIPFLKEHETGVIETAAIITSSLRWIITFMPIDGIQFRLSRTLLIWEGLSAILSVAFAVVEVYATAFMMRAWNKATIKRDRWILGVLWFISLVVMVIVQFPPLYANVMGVNVNTLPQWMVVIWIVSVALSTFVVIAGVSYADTLYKQKTQPKPTKPVKNSGRNASIEPAATETEEKSYRIMTQDEFNNTMVSLGKSAPQSVSQAESRFNLSHATAGRLLKAYREGFKNG